MQNLIHLCSKANLCYEIVQEKLVLIDAERSLALERLRNVQSMLYSALHELQKKGRLGDLNRDVDKQVRYALDQLLNLLVFSSFTRGFMRAFQKLPEYVDPEREGRSFVWCRVGKLIERRRETEEIVSLLLRDDHDHDKGPTTVVVPILGMPGSGTTSLVGSIVCLEPRVIEHFQLILQFGIARIQSTLEIELEVLKRAIGKQHFCFGSRDLDVDFFSKKYLLVLHDLFDEDPYKWNDFLRSFLSKYDAVSKPGSKIIITSRSVQVQPQVVLQLSPPYHVKSPPHHECFALFKSIAFRGLVEEADLLDIALEIFNKFCHNLNAITIVASFLSSQPIFQKWHYFNHFILASVDNPVDFIQTAVDLIQRHNDASLHSFFTYSSLFPYDHKFSMPEMHHSLYHAIEEPKLRLIIDELKSRGYLLEHKTVDKFGVVVYYKLHILMHAVVKYLTIEGCCLLDKPTNNVVGSPYLMKSPPHHERFALFKSIAFRGIAEEADLLNIALLIFNQCHNNLNAIKTIASLLSSEPTFQKWHYFNHNLVTSVNNPVQFIKTAVNFIQINRDESLHSLFTYISLFPYDYKFSMPELHYLCYIKRRIPETRTIKELKFKGYLLEHETIDKFGVVVYYQLHFLMHAVVKYLTPDDESCLLDKPTNNVDVHNIKHASFLIDSSWQPPSWLSCATLLESLFFFPRETCRPVIILNIHEILPQLKALVALDLSMVHLTSYPDFIGDLKQLRYLKLGSSVYSLPDSITNLKYLTTLDLRHTSIRKLPENFGNLSSSLRHLHTGGRLIDLPPYFGTFELLSLDEFIVGENNGLRALTRQTDLSGKLKIRFQEGRQKHKIKLNSKLLKVNKLDDLSLAWSSLNGKPFEDNNEERDSMEFKILEATPSLKRLVIQGWNGVRFPRLVTDQFRNEFENLVILHIVHCSRLQHLPPLSSLPSLEFLQLWGLKALEWIEISDVNHKAASSSTPAYFPFLKYLLLANLPELKGWSMVADNDVDEKHQKHEKGEYKIFNCVSEVRVTGCPNLMSMPLAPNLETLEASNIHEKLLKHLLTAKESSSSTECAKLERLHIKSVRDLQSLSINAVSLQVLTIMECENLTTLFLEASNSCKQLRIGGCHRLRNICHAPSNTMSSIKELQFENCNAELIDEIEGSRVFWQGLTSIRSLTFMDISKPEPLPRDLNYLTTLRKLSLCWLYNLSILPHSIGQLTQLNELVIQYCPKLRKIPDYFPNLKCLTKLEIKECWKLEKRCMKPDGEDYNLIKHIPHVSLGALPRQEGSKWSVSQEVRAIDESLDLNKLDNIIIRYCY